MCSLRTTSTVVSAIDEKYRFVTNEAFTSARPFFFILHELVSSFTKRPVHQPQSPCPGPGPYPCFPWVEIAFDIGLGRFLQPLSVFPCNQATHATSRRWITSLVRIWGELQDVFTPVKGSVHTIRLRFALPSGTCPGGWVEIRAAIRGRQHAQDHGGYLGSMIMAQELLQRAHTAAFQREVALLPEASHGCETIQDARNRRVGYLQYGV